MLLTIVITKNEIHSLVRRRNDSTILRNVKTSGDLGACLNESIKQAMSKKWKVSKPISTAIILPLDATGWVQKIDAFKRKYSNDIRIVFEDVLANSYLKGAGKDIDSSDYVLLNNQGNGSEMFFYKPDGQSQLSLLPEMSTDNGLKKLSDHVVAEFAKEGLMLGESQEKQLLEQIRKGGKGGKYSIQKRAGSINIEASINVSKSDYEDKVSEEKSILSKYLHPKILQTSPNLKEIVLIGDYFDNQVLQDYLKNELKLGSLINRNSFKSLEDIVNSASVTGFGGIEKFQAQEQAQQEKIEGLKRKRDKKIARESLLLEIRQTCVDPAKVDEYKLIFAKKADGLGIPREVIMWNIDEIIDTLELEQELGMKTEIPVVSSSNLEKIEQVTSVEIPSTPPPVVNRPNPTPAKTELVKPTTSAKREVNTPVFKKASSGEQLSSIFKTKRRLRNLGFEAQVGELVHQPGTEKVLRFVSTNELRISSNKENFENLHNKESMYYENMSPIHSSSFGKYYFRDSLEGEPLSAFIKKNASRFKADIEKWSSADLKLILKIWKEVDNLDYNYDIEADDIIVLSKLTWSLKREMDIKLVNFKYKEITKEQMEDKMHKALLQLFGKNIYQNLRKKFSM
ncbi:MAG: hypothetical protein ACI94Y_003963 [Maribacter sp.]|jgi:hypothetical protein